MDRSKIQRFPPNVLVRKISLNRLKTLLIEKKFRELKISLQKLSVYGKSPHRAITWRSLYFTQWNLQTKSNP